MKNEGSNNVSWKVLGMVAVVAFGLVFGIIYAEYIQTDSEETNQYNQTDTEQTREQKLAQSFEDVELPYRVDYRGSVRAILEEFEEDEDRAESKYEDSVVAVYGKIENIEESLGGSPVVHLTERPQIDFGFPKGTWQEVSKLEEGEYAMISGKFNYYVFGDIGFEESTIHAYSTPEGVSSVDEDSKTSEDSNGDEYSDTSGLTWGKEDKIETWIEDATMYSLYKLEEDDDGSIVIWINITDKGLRDAEGYANGLAKRVAKLWDYEKTISVTVMQPIKGSDKVRAFGNSLFMKGKLRGYKEY